jgi:hypothetical protein
MNIYRESLNAQVEKVANLDILKQILSPSHKLNISNGSVFGGVQGSKLGDLSSLILPVLTASLGSNIGEVIGSSKFKSKVNPELNTAKLNLNNIRDGRLTRSIEDYERAKEEAGLANLNYLQHEADVQTGGMDALMSAVPRFFSKRKKKKLDKKVKSYKDMIKVYEDIHADRADFIDNMYGNDKERRQQYADKGSRIGAMTGMALPIVYNLIQNNKGKDKIYNAANTQVMTASNAEKAKVNMLSDFLRKQLGNKSIIKL